MVLEAEQGCNEKITFSMAYSLFSRHRQGGRRKSATNKGLGVLRSRVVFNFPKQIDHNEKNIYIIFVFLRESQTVSNILSEYYISYRKRKRKRAMKTSALKLPQEAPPNWHQIAQDMFN